MVVSLMHSASGIGPGGCSASDGAEYGVTLITLVFNRGEGFLSSSEPVLVRAQTTIRLSVWLDGCNTSVTRLKKYSVPFASRS